MSLRRVVPVLGAILVLLGWFALELNGYSNESGDTPANSLAYAIVFFAVGVPLLIGGTRTLPAPQRHRMLRACLIVIVVLLVLSLPGLLD